MANFAMVGAAGFIAPRHMKAIRDTGNQLVAAIDPHDSVGVLDSHFPGARFFTEIERFDRHLEKLRHETPDQCVDYVTVCSPNYLHDAHVRLALRVGAHAICEKPLVINPWNLDQLKAVEDDHGKRVYTVLQLRLHEQLKELKRKIDAEPSGKKHQVDLAYITRRGQWYNTSWKGDLERSGGVAMNIGIHFFDMLMWVFGPAEQSEVYLSEENRASGFLALAKADVRWHLSLDPTELPEATREAGQTTYRSVDIDGQEFEFSQGFTDLHTRVYEDVLAGGGFGIEDARAAVELAHGIRTTPVVAAAEGRAHPLSGR